jgi:putative membrane protein
MNIRARIEKLLFAIAGKVCAAALAAVALAASAPLQAAGGSGAGSTGGTSSVSAPNTGRLSSTDMAFLVQAAQVGNAEMMAAKLVRTKNTSDEVRSYASQLLADHTRMADQLKKLAASKGVELPADTTANPRDQQKITQLSTLDGAEFDRKFAEDIGIKAHKDAIELFSNAARSTKDRDIERFASANLAALKHHLQMAEGFSKKVSMK